MGSFVIAHKIKLLIKINVLFTFFYFYSFSFQQISKPSYLFFELTDQLAISIFIHHSLTDDLFGSIRIPEKEKEMYSKALWYTDSRYAVRAQKIVFKAVVNKDANSKLTCELTNPESTCH